MCDSWLPGYHMRMKMEKILIKRGMVMLLVCTMLLSSVPVSVFAEEDTQYVNTFTDVSESDYYYEAVRWAVETGVTTGVYYYDAMLWAVENGIVTGTSATTFSPNNTVTRGQVITFLHRMMGKPSSSTTNPFTDVSESDYYYDAVLWALESGVTTGATNTQFNPGTVCTRVQVITFLWRALNKNTDDGTNDDDMSDDSVNNDDSKEDGTNDDNSNDNGGAETDNYLVNAADYGLSPKNSGYNNSTILQNLVNDLSANEPGAAIYIPAGEYKFAEIGTQTIGSHCVKMQSNVSIKGDGESTVLKPEGASNGGLDMFYFNDYVDTGKPVYLENCDFEDFVIDGAGTSCKTYTSAGKGFMFNLFKNCNWKNVVVKNTDATGFGVDCPIGGSIVDCIAINCGKAATTSNGGASGFGIGFGYSEDEYFTISNCQSYDNKKFGFFFEHQGRFSSTKYKAAGAEGFLITDCTASGNYYNFGGLLTMDTVYENCTSSEALRHGYFFENSKDCKVIGCTSENEANTSFVILQSGGDGGAREVTNIVYDGCTSTGSLYGVKVSNYTSTALMSGNVIKNCQFYANEEYTVSTTGTMAGLTLTGNTSDTNNNDFSAVIGEFVDTNNSWN